MIANVSELAIELINRELLIFRLYQVDVKNIKCPFQRWETHENKFLTFGLCVRQILGILGSQIEMQRIFSLIGILTSLKRCHI